MAVNAFDSLEWSRRRAENADRIRSMRIEELSHVTSETCSATAVAIGHQDSCQGCERWIEHCLAITRLTRVKVVEPLVHCKLKRVVIREITLNNNLSGLISTTR